MQFGGTIRRLSPLLFSVGLCFSVACGDDDEVGTSADASASTADEGGVIGRDGSVNGGSDAGIIGGRSDAGTANGGSDASANGGGSDGGLAPGCPVMVNEAQCDKTKRPIVFVHGTSANGDSFAHPAMLLASNGYCADRIRAIEYNSLIARTGDGGLLLPPSGGLDGGVARPDGGEGGVGEGGLPSGFLNTNYMGAKAAIDRAIEELRAQTGTDKVDMLGHSQGSGHGSRYAGENPDKVARYVHLAGGALAADPGGVPTLCLSSTGDRPVECKTTKNVIIQDVTVDHSAVASSTEAFIEIYKFFNDEKAPQYTEIQCGDPIMLEGRAPTLGDNTFLPGSKIEVHELGDNPIVRGAPAQVFTIGADGNFGPWQAKRGVAYEFKLIPPPGDAARTRVIRTYFRPFVRSNRLLRFNFQTLDPNAGATGNALPLDDKYAIMVPRRLQKAFMHPRDSLTIDGFEVVSAANTLDPMTGRSRTVAALYLFEGAPSDGISTGAPVTLPRGAFVSTADVFMPAMTPAFINVVFKESTTGFTSTLKIPNWPSATEGVSVVFVD